MTDLTQLKASLIAEIDDYITDFEKAGQVAIQFGKAQKQTGDQLKQNDSKYDNAVKKLKGFTIAAGAVVATVTGMGLAAKQAYDFIAEGAQLERTESQFRNVADAAGYTADTLLGKMRRATKGLVTDAELMRSGLDIMELGLAKNEDGVVRLANAVATLGLDMQTVILTFSNDSKMRLDSLGLSVESVTKRVAELNAQGFKGDAFDEAVLEGLENRMAILGDSSQDTTGHLEQLGVVWANTMDRMKRGAADLAGPLIEVAAAEEQIKQARDAGIISGDMAIELINRATWTNYTFAEALEYVLEQERLAQMESERFAYYQDVLAQTNDTLASATHRYSQAQAAANDRALAGAEKQRRLAEEAEATAEILDVLVGKTGDLDGAFSNNTSTAQNMIEEWEWAQAGGQDLEDIITTIGGLQVEPDVKRELLEEALTAAVELDISLGKLKETEGAQILKDSLDLSTLDEAKALLRDGQDGILDDLENLDGSIYKATADLEDKTAGLRTQLSSFVNKWEGTHYATFVANYVENGILPGEGRAGDGNDGSGPQSVVIGPQAVVPGRGEIHYHFHDNLALKKVQEMERQANLASLARMM